MTKICPSERTIPNLAKNLAIGIALALSACRGAEAPESPVASSESASTAIELRIRTANGVAHRFTTELAITNDAQERGLSGRTALSQDAAMLFPFPYPKMASFWMKNTLIPLDLLFIRSDGTIAEILHGEPESLQPIAANEPVIAVLEINYGRAEALNIKPGDRAEWGDCSTAQGAEPAWQADRLCPAMPQ